MAKFDTYQEVTDSIIAALEAGTAPWSAGWQNGGINMPRRACGIHYRGVNVLLLWASAMGQGFASEHWLTFKQAQALGGSVRKGEKSTRIVFFKPLDVKGKDGGEDRKIPMLRTYNVFNADQVDGLPDALQAAAIAANPALLRDAEREEALRSCGAVIREQGAAAFYEPAADRVTMPEFERFTSAGNYLATLAHELCHWTGHKSRLAREMRGTFGSPDYAREELIAELGSAFVNARLGIVGDHIESHAAYLKSWVKVLKEDKRAIFRAASAAQAAADLVLVNAGELAGELASEEPASDEPASAPAVERQEAIAPAPAPIAAPQAAFAF